MSVFQSFMTGARAGQEDYQRGQRRQIGGLMASGDYTGAMNQAYGAGEFPLAQYAGQQGQAVKTQGVRQEAGRLYADDPLAAQNYALGQGDFDLAEQLQGWAETATEQERKAAEGRFELIGGLASAMLQVPMDQRAAYVQTMAPQLAPLGVTAEQLAGLDLSDASLQGFVSTSMGATNYLTMLDRRDREAADRILADRRVSVTERREGRVNSGGRVGGGSRSSGGGSSRPVPAQSRSSSGAGPWQRYGR
jgi:hypothetical protein